MQVGALVVGHVLALVLAHDRALAIYGDARSAARSQYWMLAMMVGFTPSACSCSRFERMSAEVILLLAHIGHWWTYVLYRPGADRPRLRS